MRQQKNNLRWLCGEKEAQPNNEDDHAHPAASVVRVRLSIEQSATSGRRVDCVWKTLL